MKRTFTLLLAGLCLATITRAQLVQTCFLENFNSPTTGWIYSQGASEGNYNLPGGCGGDRGIVTPGVGGNNPANIKTPVFTSNGAIVMQVNFDIFCLNANLNCSSWKNYDCPTSIDVFYITGGQKFTAIRDLVLPPNGPGNSPTVNFMFNTNGKLPAGTTYQLEVAFKMKSGIGNCGQPGTKYVLDNFGKCEINCIDCTIDANDDVFCNQNNDPVTFSGSLVPNDQKYQGATVTYSLANGPFANGNAQTGGANLTINPDGTFTIVRTDMTKTIFDFTYRISESTFGMSDLASCRVCFPDGAVVPIILTEFTAARKQKNVLLNWKTASEINADRFELERKSNGDFEKIGTVMAENHETGSSYLFTDVNASATESQYRIRMIDRDGTYKYSQIRQVKGIGAAFDFSIFPNPTANGFTRLQLGDISEPVTVRLIDQAGRVLKTFVSANRGNIDLQSLKPGSYHIQVTRSTTGDTQTKMLVVIR